MASSEDIQSLDPRRHELLEARIFGTGPRGHKAIATNSNQMNTGLLQGPGTVVFNCNSSELSSGPQTSSDYVVVPDSSLAIQLQAPPPGTNESSNLSSAGSTSDREPETPEKLPNSSADSRVNGGVAGTSPAPSSAPPARKRKRRKNVYDPDGNLMETGAKTPKSERKISEFLVKTSPQRASAGGAAINNGSQFAFAQNTSGVVSTFQPGPLQFAPICPADVQSTSATSFGAPTNQQQRTTPTHLVSYASSDSNQSPPTSSSRLNSTQTQTDIVDLGKSDELQRKKDSLTLVVEDQRQQLLTQTARNQELESTLSRIRDVTSKLLIDQSTMDRKQRKAKVMEHCLRLGQFRPERRVGHFEEVWVDGYAFEEVQKRLKQINTERNEINQASQLLRKRKPTLGSSAKSEARRLQQAAQGVTQLNCAPPSGLLATASTSATTATTDDGFLRPEPPKDLSMQEYHEQDEIYRLRKEQLKREEAELQAELDRLDRERNLHIRELKRVQNEEASRFKDNTVLNKRFLLLCMLGKGGFSEVWRAFDLEDLRYVACKIHHVNKEWKEDKKANYVKHALREKDIHKTLIHPRIVRLFDLFTIDNHSFCTVLEYCSGNDLDFYLKQNKTIPEKEARSIIMQVVSALHYLNEIRPPIIHYDLKPANILLQYGTASGELKLTDFGLSKIMEEDKYDPQHGMDLTSQGAGTYWYLPPECFVIGQQPPKISSKVDVWSVGVIFYQCLYGKRPFGHDLSQAKILEENTILNATEVHFPPKPTVSGEAKNFIRRCLQYRKEERADVIQLYQHEYLRPKATKAASTTPSSAQVSNPALSPVHS